MSAFSGRRRNTHAYWARIQDRLPRARVASRYFFLSLLFRLEMDPCYAAEFSQSRYNIPSCSLHLSQRSCPDVFPVGCIAGLTSGQRRLKPNLPPNPDSAMTVLDTNTTDFKLIAVSASPFCHYLWAVLKWIFPRISWSLFSPGLSHIITTSLCSCRGSTKPFTIS